MIRDIYPGSGIFSILDPTCLYRFLGILEIMIVGLSSIL
jgi:hypothetical protein